MNNWQGTQPQYSYTEIPTSNMSFTPYQFVPQISVPMRWKSWVRVTWTKGVSIDSGPFYSVEGREAFMAAAITRNGVTSCQLVWKDRDDNELTSDDAQ